MAGLLLARLGHIPRAGDRLEDSGVVFEVLEATPYAVKRVRAARAGGGAPRAR
ncbi:MAG: transporter associated domain-containing protein [Phycisphaerales bacterium]